MSPNNIINSSDLDIDDSDFQDDSANDTDKDIGTKQNAKTRQRIDELLEKKRLKDLLDEDEWDF